MFAICLENGLSTLAWSKSEMSNTWSDMETFKLLEIWGEDDVQEQLNKSKRNSHVYDRIASQMKN